MAKNLQAKLPPSDSIRIFDLNKNAAHQLAQEMKTSQAGGAVVEVAQSVNDVAKDSVCSNRFLPPLCHNDEHISYL
jgi:3-hydroxyisobutyrate/3-hydroxypropionate dehydrogenase